MKLEYHYCAEPDVACEMCEMPTPGEVLGYAFELHRHEYDPFDYDKPTHKWLCSEACVKAWNECEPAEPSSEDNSAADDAHRMNLARRLK